MGKYEVCVSSELYDTGHWSEDGEKIIKEKFFVTFLNGFGRMMRHVEEFGKYDVDKAEKLADEIQAYLDRGGKLDRSKWVHWRFMYGSEGWIRYGEAEQIAFEKQQEENRYW